MRWLIPLIRVIRGIRGLNPVSYRYSKYKFTMNINDIQRCFTLVCAAGGISCIAAILLYSARHQLRQLFDRWQALGRLGQCISLLMLTVFVLYGGSKPSYSGTGVSPVHADTVAQLSGTGVSPVHAGQRPPVRTGKMPVPRI